MALVPYVVEQTNACEIVKEQVANKDINVFTGKEFLGTTYEVNAAMLAIEYGIENGFEKVIIHHDYTGIAGWANGWKANEEGSKVYKEYIEEAREKIAIEFVKVKAHSKDELNDLADALAKKVCGINE